MTRDLVYGRNAVREALRGPREVLEVWASERAVSALDWLAEGPRPRVHKERELTEAAGDKARWQVRLPLGQELTYSTEVFDKQPGERVRWASSGDSPPATGSVRFTPAPGAWGTVVTLRLEFTPPGGALGEAAANVFKSVPETVVSKALRRFKSLAETGEIPTLGRNPSARGLGDRL